MKFKIILVICFLVSCSTHRAEYKKKHRDFMVNLERMKKKDRPDEYKAYMTKQRRLKVEEIDQLKGLIGNQENLLSHQETMDSGGTGDIHHFQAKTTKMKLKHLEERIKILESEIFTLDSQLSSFE